MSQGARQGRAQPPGYSDRQAQPLLAHTLRTHLIQFLRPVAERLAAHLDIRPMQTALDLVQVILTHRHRVPGLLLTELGGYLLSPAQAPVGAKTSSPREGVRVNLRLIEEKPIPSGVTLMRYVPDRPA